MAWYPGVGQWFVILVTFVIASLFWLAVETRLAAVIVVAGALLVWFLEGRRSLSKTASGPSAAARSQLASRLPTRSSLLYIGGALLFALLAAVSAGLDPATAEGLGYFTGHVGLWALVGWVRSLFGPTSIPRWTFWGSLVGLGISSGLLSGG